MRISVTYSGFDRLVKKYELMGERIRDGVEGWIEDDAKKYVTDKIKEGFNKEGRLGGRWAPLASQTIEERTREIGAGKAKHPILERTGELKELAIGGRGNAPRVHSGRGVVRLTHGFPNTEAGRHKGLDNQLGNDVPARPMIGLTEEDRKKLRKQLHKQISETLQA